MKVNPPASDPSAHDAVIVIFGAAVRPDGRPSQTLRYRVAAAALFGKRFARPLFIATGGRGRFGDTEAAVMARLLTDAGYPETAIRREETGTDTLSSVRAVVRLVRGQSPVYQSSVCQSPIYACTSFYHLPRCLTLLRLAGMPVRPVPPPRVPAATSVWRRWYWRLREAPAVPYDALVMLWLRAIGRV
ncbi:MAG TPA: YdcF family protein [Rhodopila sp.]|jgi:uncharacterized SAM-binding protein YcdF (DUF218 family)